MKAKALLAAALAAIAFGARADFSIDLDIGTKPIKDVRTSTCGPEIGYAGTLASQQDWGLDEEFLFGEDAENTARLMKEAGAWLQRMWSANAWYGKRDKVDPKTGKKGSHPKLVFDFWKKYGFKVLFTLEAWGGAASRKEIGEFVKFIVDNGYKDVVAGFELGNESYFAQPEQMVPLCETWAGVIDDIWALWPKVPMGIPICELLEKNPDLTQVRNRMLAEGKIKRDSYFSAGYFNQTSARMILELKKHGKLDRISHVIYHAYGAETPYSCSYYGFERFRNFTVAFPELKGKNFWLTEIRPRSDEDNRCQRLFRETLIMAHYAQTAICQPDMDGFNHHQIHCISGGLYQSVPRGNARQSSWQVQWQDAGGEFPDYRTLGKLRMEVGHAGVMYRIYAEAIKSHPLVMHHGTSREMNTTNSFYTSANVCDQVYARRRAIKEGRRKDAPKVAGEVEWTALLDANRGDLCLLMVNTKSEPETIRLTVKDRQFAAPVYRTLTCPEKFLDCREVPGDGKTWRQVSWEDTQCGYDVVAMEKYDGLKPSCDSLEIMIEPHTVQAVNVALRKSVDRAAKWGGGENIK